LCPRKVFSDCSGSAQYVEKSGYHWMYDYWGRQINKVSSRL
jgi:hypothetical protein